MLDESTQKNSRTETTSIEFSEELGFEWFRCLHVCNSWRLSIIETRKDKSVSVNYSEFLDLLLPKALSCLMMSHDVSCWGCPAVMSHILKNCPSRLQIRRLKCKLIDLHFLKHWNWKEPWKQKTHFFWPSQFDSFGLCCGTLAINWLSCPMLPACSIYISNPSSVTLLCTYLHLCGEHHCGIVHFFRADWSPMLTELLLQLQTLSFPMNFSILRSWHLVRKFMR